MPRDIGHEQVSTSTDAELGARLKEILGRGARSYPPHTYSPQLLRELQQINSELYCRANGIASTPWLIYMDTKGKR